MNQNVLFVNFPTILYNRLLDCFSGGELENSSWLNPSDEEMSINYEKIINSFDYRNN